MTRMSVGLDLSLSASGVAVICEGVDRPQLHVCTVPGLPELSSVEDELSRMSRMASKVIRTIRSHIEPGEPDDPDGGLLFNFEGPIMHMKGGKSDERAGLRWIIALNLQPLGRIMFSPPTSAKQYWTGNGGADKKTMMHMAALRYPGLALLDNNAVDALALAHMGASHLGFDQIPRSPAVNLSALSGARWLADLTKGTTR